MTAQRFFLSALFFSSRNRELRALFTNRVERRLNRVRSWSELSFFLRQTFVEAILRIKNKWRNFTRKKVPKQAVSRVLSRTIIYLRGGQFGGRADPIPIRQSRLAVERVCHAPPSPAGEKCSFVRKRNTISLFTFGPAQFRWEFCEISIVSVALSLFSRSVVVNDSRRRALLGLSSPRTEIREAIVLLTWAELF